MTQILLHQKAYQRIAERLRERFGDTVEPVLWDSDGTLSRHGEPVAIGSIRAQAVWFSADVLASESLTAIAATVAQLPSVRWIQSANAGLDHPAYESLFGQGIKFSKSGAQSIPIAEYVLTYALEHVQNTALRREAQTQQRWRPHRFDELWHSNWLIVGYGHIGRNVAKRAKAFDCHTIIVRRSDQTDSYADEVLTLSQINDHLPRADVIVLACPVTAATLGLVDREFLTRLKAGSLLINVARGALIDEQALLASLDQGRPARAVLDVFTTEPLPADNPLWQHPCVTITAHTSNAGSGTRGRGDELFLSNLQRFINGKDPDDLVNPD